MKDNPIKNDAQARTAERYAEYLAKKLREPDMDPGNMDFALNQMTEIAHALADYYEKDEWVGPVAKLVVHNRLPKPSKVGRPDLRIVQ